jgi:glyoxylase-like metal-dependent hydrolase (beta-lactamase superfamily II)
VIAETELTLVPDGEMLTPSGEGVYGVPSGECVEDGWAGYTPPDEEGNVAVMPCSLLVRFRRFRSPGRIALVDTGGENPDEVPGRRSDFLERLSALGVRPEDVGAVVITHAHLDHIGWNTRCAGGKRRPTFPNATYTIQKIEAESFRAADPARWERYFGPIEDAGLLRPVSGDAEVAPGLRVLVTPGHTVGHQSVLVECGGSGSAIYLGDLAVTKLHLEHLDWHPTWCASTADDRASKERIIRLALERDALVILGHDPNAPFGRLERRKGGGVVAVEVPAAAGKPGASP